MPQSYNISNISSLAEFMPDIYNSFSQQKASGYPNSRTAPVPEINFYNDVNRDFLIDAINKRYSQNNALQIGPRYYQRDPNFIGPELYNQMTNGQDFASYISNPNNGYKIANEEEEEYDAGEVWKNAEIERRNAIQQKFTPLETPNYLQQAQDALKSFSVKKSEDSNLNVQQNSGDGSGKSVGEWFNNNSQQISAGLSAAGAIGDHFLNKSYKGNQGAYVSGAFGKNTALNDVNNTNTAIASTNFNDAMQQYKGISGQLNSQKTSTLSGGQIGGMAGVGAAKGAAAGAAFGPYGMLIGGVVGGAAGLGKGVLANKKIKETNEAIADKQTTANNYLNYSFGDIRNRNANLRKASMYSNVVAYGGNLYAFGGKTKKKKYKAGDIIDIDSKTMKQMLDEGYTFEKTYDVNDVVDIDDKEVKRLKKLGYEFEEV